MAYIHLLWGFISWCITCHLLPHDLLESSVVTSLSELKQLLGFCRLSCNNFVTLLELVDVGPGQYACFMRLPLSRIELFKRHCLRKYFSAIGPENLEAVVDLETLVESTGQHVSSAG